MIIMNKLDLIEAFIAIADNGSLHKAAGKLFQTDAAISKKLSKLEEYLRTQLIQRGRKGLKLTAAGQRYYHEAKKALAQFDVAEQCILQETRQPRGELRVTSMLYYAQTLILPRLADFLNRYPEIRVILDIAEVLPDFNARKMDILFGISHSGDEQLVRKRIDTSRYVLCASPRYIKKHGMPHSSAELLQHDYISHWARKPPELIPLDHDQQIEVTPKLLVNNSQIMIQAALANLGFIWTHEFMVAQLVAQKKLLYLLPQQMQRSVNVYVYHEYQAYLDPKISVFMDFYTE
jgi:DNA-binding transcriptional LysR family regulator